MAPAHSRSEAEPRELLLQIDRIAKSSAFAGSEILRGLLEFLSKAAIERPGQSIREAEIAAVVLSRRDFDARVDSGVRVHTARLRARLAEYYLGEGAGDPVMIEIQKRSYQLLYWNRGLPAAAAEQSALKKTAGPERWRRFAPPAVALAACGLALMAWTSRRRAAPPAELRTFWSAFLESDQRPMVVFANSRFTGSAATGLRPLARGVQPSTPAVDDYTGVGEVTAVHRLTQLFASFDREIHLKRSPLVTWDDARQRNLILVGGPETNAVLAALPQPHRFCFTVVSDSALGPHSAIEDLKAPVSGPRFYSNSGRPYQFDHAVIALTTDSPPRHPVLSLAGTTTMGTQAAVEYVTDADNLKNLIAVLRVGRGGLQRFEALLKVSLREGVPVSTEILAAERW
jgi:hypothetical protein